MQSRAMSHIIRFGVFELDLQEVRLTKSGRSIRLQGQPFRILALLLQNAGKVVSREEMRRELWSDETFVGFDDALNTAVRKLRLALGDKAGNPRFIETVPRLGYRFIAPIVLSEPETADPPVEVPVLQTPTQTRPQAMDLAEQALATLSPEVLWRAASKARWVRVTIMLAGSIVAAAAIGLTYPTVVGLLTSQLTSTPMPY